jgi:hypothetical protein
VPARRTAARVLLALIVTAALLVEWGVSLDTHSTLRPSPGTQHCIGRCPSWPSHEGRVRLAGWLVLGAAGLAFACTFVRRPSEEERQNHDEES